MGLQARYVLPISDFLLFWILGADPGLQVKVYVCVEVGGWLRLRDFCVVREGYFKIKLIYVCNCGWSRRKNPLPARLTNLICWLCAKRPHPETLNIPYF